VAFTSDLFLLLWCLSVFVIEGESASVYELMTVMRQLWYAWWEDLQKTAGAYECSHFETLSFR